MLSGNEYRMLGILRDGPFAVSELAEMLGIPQGLAVASAVMLERRGLAVYDRDARGVSITEDGRLARWALQDVIDLTEGRPSVIAEIVKGELPCPNCGKPVKWTYKVDLIDPEGDSEERLCFELKGARL